ncbi:MULTISPECIES: MerR family transcriptional regulator [Hungatella]|nr:MerR family transcriptional regulator [Hungatella hathewayi]
MMMTVKQVSVLTGVSVRTLQFYDEIGLLKPTQMTESGYRLYDESALEVLQQILFFKELDFTLREIKVIMENPQFDKKAAFEKQKELIRLKRDRLNGLLELLDKLIHGETCMDFKEFDMSEYFQALGEFKATHTEEIIRRLGSMEQFDELFGDLQSQEVEIAEAAVRQYGSIENFTKAMKENFQNYLSEGPVISETEVDGIMEKTELLTKRLTADLTRDPSSAEVQAAVSELIAFCEESNRGIDMGENYWLLTAEAYQSNPMYLEVNDRKYGEGASKFIGSAIKEYLDRK